MGWLWFGCSLPILQVTTCLSRIGRNVEQQNQSQQPGAGFNGRANNLILILRHVQTTKKWLRLLLICYRLRRIYACKSIYAAIESRPRCPTNRMSNSVKSCVAKPIIIHHYFSAVPRRECAHEGRAEDDGQLPQGVAALPQLRQELWLAPTPRHHQGASHSGKGDKWFRFDRLSKH